MIDLDIPDRRKHHSPMIWAIVTMLVLTTAACRFGRQVFDASTSSPTPTQESIEELSQLATQTKQAMEALYTETPSPAASTTAGPTEQPTLAPSATSTTAPTDAPPANGGAAPTSAIRFLPGGTISMLQRDIGSGQPHQYSFIAMEGQTVIVAVASPDEDVTLGVERTATGQDLVSPSSGRTDWSGTIPASGEYRLRLETGNPDTYYFLTLEIPANIFFDSGETSATISGHVEVFDAFHPEGPTRVRYLAYARAGQTMEVSLTSPNLEGLSMGIIGQSDGQAYARYHVKTTEFEFELPSTQGYYIDVYALDGKSTDFTLRVEIE